MPQATAHIFALLAALLVATNAAWILVYQNLHTENTLLHQRLQDLNNTLSKLAEQAKSLDEENTKLLLQLQEARKSYENLLRLLEAANTSTKAALINILAKLNTTITTLYRYTFSHAYYTPMVRALYRPSQVADKVYAILGTPIYRPKAWSQDMVALFNWTQKNIQYAPDHHFAAIKDIQYVKIGDKKYISSFTVDITDNYIQEPVETLLRGAGDCEDMAILLSSMYSIYLHDVGQAWVLCLLAQDFSHCFSLAYIRPNNTYVLADPSTGFYTASKTLMDAIQQWLAYIGVKWENINRAIVFNNKFFDEGPPYNIVKSIEEQAKKS